MDEIWKDPPVDGTYVVRIHAIGHSDLIFEEEKSLRETDIFLSVKKVIDGGEWPVKVETHWDEKEAEIEHSEWIQNMTEVNGIHTINTPTPVSFSYSFVKDDPRIQKTYQNNVIVEQLRIGDDMYFVEDLELRRCRHPDLMKIKNKRSKSGNLVNLVGGELGEGESLICTQCNSIIE